MIIALNQKDPLTLLKKILPSDIYHEVLSTLYAYGIRAGNSPEETEVQENLLQVLNLDRESLPDSFFLRWNDDILKKMEKKNFKNSDEPILFCLGQFDQNLRRQYKIQRNI